MTLADLLATRRHVLLDFDGSVCALFGGVGAPNVARRMAEEIRATGVAVSADADASGHPFDVLHSAAQAGAADVGEELLRAYEVDAVASAPMTDGLPELLDTLRASGHTVTIVSNTSDDAVHAFLRLHDLSARIDGVSARADRDLALLKPSPHLVNEALARLDARPNDGVLVGDSAADLDAGRAAGVAVIAYANEAGKAQRLAALAPDALTEDLRTVQAEASGPDATAGLSRPSVLNRVRRARNDLAPAERRVVETLLADYPMVGLGSVGSLAAAAGVSAPTVLRLLAKLGFGGYPDFREQLRGEVAARYFSSEDVYPAFPADGVVEHPLRRAERAYAEAVRTTFRDLDPAEVDMAVAALADNPQVLVGGGRFSAALAAYFAWLLQTLRPGVAEVPPDTGNRSRALLSVDAQTLLVVLDFRPYQRDTIEFTAHAAQRGARVLLVCDRNLSPIAPTADFVLATSVDGPAPFDSMASGLMVAETLLSGVAARLGEPARQRLLDFEAQLHPPGEVSKRDFGTA